MIITRKIKNKKSREDEEKTIVIIEIIIKTESFNLNERNID